MVKVDLGVHIDGYVAVVAHTVVAGAFPFSRLIPLASMYSLTYGADPSLFVNPPRAGPAPTAEAPIKGPMADVFMAAITAGEVAAKLIKPGNTNTQVGGRMGGVVWKVGVARLVDSYVD